MHAASEASENQIKGRRIRNSDTNPLIDAARELNISRMRELLRSGALTRKGDEEGQTALHWVVLNPFKKDGSIQEQAIQLLVDHKAKLNLKNNKGQTALHIATETNQIAIVRLLLARGAKVSVQDAKGNHPLHIAVMCRYYAMMGLLMECAANPFAMNFDRETAWDWVMDTKDIEAVHCLFPSTTLLYYQDKLGNTPLHHAVTKGAVAVFEWIMKYGADPLIENKRGQTAWDLALSVEDVDSGNAICAYFEQYARDHDIPVTESKKRHHRRKACRQCLPKTQGCEGSSV